MRRKSERLILLTSLLYLAVAFSQVDCDPGFVAKVLDAIVRLK